MDVTADQANLVFKKAIPQDAQVYQCEVQNYPDATPDKSDIARIEVYSKCEHKNHPKSDKTFHSSRHRCLEVIRIECPAIACS